MKKILINKTPWQTRIALTEENRTQNIYFSAPQADHLERSYYKGHITKVLPGIQTAFVDIGKEKAGFLHISEVDRDLAIEKMSRTMQLDEPHRTPSREKIDIAKIFKEGDDVLVQVSKEPVYEKGAKLTTCFTLPGRFIVLMPNIPRIGVSKRIENREERNRLKEVVAANLPEGMGAIIRTSSENRDQKEIIKDINYLVSIWDTIQKQFAAAKATDKVYEDLELSLQIVRDNLDDNVETIITDDQNNQQEIIRFIKKIAPEFVDRVRYYNNPINIFDFYGIQDQINNALKKKVGLKSGGSLIIETMSSIASVSERIKSDGEAKISARVGRGRHDHSGDLGAAICLTCYRAGKRERSGAHSAGGGPRRVAGRDALPEVRTYRGNGFRHRLGGSHLG